MLEQLSSRLASSRERRRNVHGWEVELTCPRCGTTGVPPFLGWTPTAATRFGNRPTIYADVACPACAASLKDAAGNKLVELFATLNIPHENRLAIVAFVTLTVVLIAAGIMLPAWRAWAWLSVVPLLVLRPLMLWFTGRVTSLLHTCPCGDPQYKFMGMLGRSMCFRCSTCGRLLRLRD